MSAIGYDQFNKEQLEEKIANFLRESIGQDIYYRYVVNRFEMESVRRCLQCALPENGSESTFDENGICGTCQGYEEYKDYASQYFNKDLNDFKRLTDQIRINKKSEYDCLLCYSGGKDSSYVLHRLVNMGYKVLTFTLDNGYISEKTFENIERTTTLLHVKNIRVLVKEMNGIFVDSLITESNVCNGCFKAVNTVGTKIAADYNINLVIDGLSRGQIFEIKLHGLFKLGIYDEEQISKSLKLFRRNYHTKLEKTVRLLDIDITDEMIESINFIDYFRYDRVSTKEIYEYLRIQDQEWARPKDTGNSSSNCLINDVGIYIHIKDRGFHFYSPQVSWECRLGIITRSEAENEIMGYEVDYEKTHGRLKEIGYYDALFRIHIAEWEDRQGIKRCYVFLTADCEINIEELKQYLAAECPQKKMPDNFIVIKEMPIINENEVDQAALLSMLEV